MEVARHRADPPAIADDYGDVLAYKVSIEPVVGLSLLDRDVAGLDNASFL
jgi:hypothetical protein